jgi:phosphatidylglycerophosphatase A
MQDKIFLFIGTGFYSGYLPKMPGTFGSAYAMLIFYIFCHDITTQIVFIISTLLLGIVIATKLEKELGHDSSKIVIDEFLGMFISLFAYTFTWQRLLLAFILFRFFDISKIAGINRLQSLPKGIGVMADDLLAGLYSLLLMQCFIYFNLI